MRTRLALLTLTAAVAACAGGGPAALGYGLPAQTEVAYAYGDTTLIEVSVMGQSMEIEMQGSAEYGVAFAPAADGLEVTLTVNELDASVGTPMAGTETVDEGAVDGALVFALDRRGNATITSTPTVSVAASRMISGLTTAHTFFPGLPDRSVTAGDRWVDTVAYEGEAEVGPFSETSVYEYTVVGDTLVDGRALLKIALAGSTESSSTSELGGMRVEQTSTLAIEGHVLWDRRAGLMYEVVRRGRGSGGAKVPIAPRPLPVGVEVTQTARLLGM